MNMSQLLKIVNIKIIRVKDKETGEITKSFGVYQVEVDYVEGPEFAGREVVEEFSSKEADFALAKRMVADIQHAHANLGQDFIYIEPVYNRVSQRGKLAFELVDYKLFKADKAQLTK